MTVAPRTRLGAYEITARLGAGAWARCRGATDTTLGRDLAIKPVADHRGPELAGSIRR